MKKNRKALIISMILSVIFFISKNHNIYAFSKNVNLDSLIENRKQQESFKTEISKIDEKIESKAKSNANETEVVSVIFTEDNKTDAKKYLINEVEIIEKEKMYLEKQLEECMIEGIKIEKIIEENKEDYLRENSLSFIPGMWPVPSYNEVSSSFGNRMHPITGKKGFHKGIDIPAPQNTDIVSADDGVVIFSGVQNGYGNVVKIKHFDGKRTIYAHNNLNIVHEGDIVKKGQIIAKVGTTGNSTGNHLHFETIINENNVNPINIVK